jgi:hypothetical protein
MALAHLSAHPELAGSRREDLLDHLEPETRELLEQGISPERWYPERHHLALYRAVVKTLGLDSDGKCFRFFMEAQRAALASSPRTNLRTLSAVLAQTPVRWRRGHDTGHLSVGQRKDDGVEAVLRDHPYAEDPVYQQVVLGGVAALVSDIVVVEDGQAELAGPQQARLRLIWRR